MHLLLMIGLTAQAASTPAIPEVRLAVARALPALQRSAAQFVARRSCFSCHHNALPVLTFHLARSRGFDVDPAVVAAVEDKTFRELRKPGALDDAVQAASLSDPTPNQSYLLMAAHAAGLEPDVARFYMPEQRRLERDRSIRAARDWLAATRPASTEDAAFRVMGLVWADAPPDQIDAARRDLVALQRPSGGWAQLSSYEPDAYSTGEALVALHESGMPAGDGRRRAGAEFLTSTQAKDGTWQVRTRMISPAEVSPMYFPTGFPYGKNEFLSFAGSNWAVMALLDSLPEPTVPPSPPHTATHGETGEPAWVRTALFGDAKELAAVLDAGLDVNSATTNGTTLLMMTAADLDKVNLLVARGANVDARAASGCDAITVAASYRGTSAILRVLIEADADVRPPEGVHLKHPALVLASMTGDLESVNLLLAHGADVDADEALSEAVTYGDADIVKSLIAADANVHATEPSGINLLHWATITNRPRVIPVLVAAGVPIDDVDERGFTPLMYAAIIDFGSDETVRALLTAGADRSIRNGEGRTALQEARRHKHKQLEAVLR